MQSRAFTHKERTVLTRDSGRSGTSSHPWFADAAVISQMPAWVRPYVAYARLRKRDGRRALLASQKTARQLRLTRDAVACIDGTAVWLDLWDQRFPWVLDELRTPSLQRRAIAWFLGPGDTFIDVGANHGSFSLLAARAVGPDGVVHVIEPQPHLAYLIRRSAEANRFRGIRVHQVALASKAGSAILHLSSNSGASHLLLGGGHEGGVAVATETLDAILDDSPCTKGNVLVKIDIEGHERECLLGSTGLLATRMPAIVIEMNPLALARAASSPGDVLSILASLGYSTFTDNVRAPTLFGAQDVALDHLHDLLAVPDTMTTLVPDITI